MLQKVVSNNSDAMNILFEAALQESESNNTTGDARITALQSTQLTDADVLRIWNACRFVKMGWFSAHEAMKLMDLYVLLIIPV